MSGAQKGSLMTNSGISQAAPIWEGNPLQMKMCGVHTHASPDKLGLWQDTATIHWAGCRKLLYAIGFLSGRPSWWVGDCAPLLTLNFFSTQFHTLEDEDAIHDGWTPEEIMTSHQSPVCHNSHLCFCNHMYVIAVTCISQQSPVYHSSHLCVTTFTCISHQSPVCHMNHLCITAVTSISHQSHVCHSS